MSNLTPKEIVDMPTESLKQLGGEIVEAFLSAENKIITEILSEFLKRPATREDVAFVSKVKEALHQPGEATLYYKGIVLGTLKWTVPDLSQFDPSAPPDKNNKIGVEFTAAKKFKENAPN